MTVTPVPIYRWDLPENLEPLHEAVRRICDRWCNAIIFLSSVQFTNLLRIAEQTGMRDALLQFHGHAPHPQFELSKKKPGAKAPGKEIQF